MKFLKTSLVVLLTLAAIAAGYYWLGQSKTTLPVGIFSGNGRIEAVQIDIASKLAGRIVDVSINEGDLVEKDQIIARIDTRQLEAALAQSEARLAEVVQTVDQAKANIIKTESDISLAKKQVDRADKLVKRKAMSQAELDLAINSLAVARATLGSNKAALRTQEFAVKAAEAQVEEIKTQIDDSILTSPARGRILYKLAEPGEVVAVGGKVATILDLSNIYMEIYLPSKHAVSTAIGSEARVVLDIDPTYSEPAHVSFVAPEAQFTPKQVETSKERDKLMFRVKVRFDPERVEPYLQFIKTGIRGVAYIRLDESIAWPDFLTKVYPDDPAELIQQAITE